MEALSMRGRRHFLPVSGAAVSAVLFLGLLGSSAFGQSTRAVFEPGACPRVPALKVARCGVLVVPESRAKPNSRTIRLPLAIIPAMSDAPAADPVVYLAGGPGGAGFSDAQQLVRAGLNRRRNLIIMGQRGT